MKVKFLRSDGLVEDLSLVKDIPGDLWGELEVEAATVQFRYQELFLDGAVCAHIDGSGDWYIDGDSLPWSDIVISP